MRHQVVVSALVGLLAGMGGCGRSSSSSAPAPAPAPAPPAAPTAPPVPPPAPPPASVPYTLAPGMPEWSATYAANNLHDGAATYWCTSMGPTFPIDATLGLAAPTPITGLDFDTRVAGYESSAINVVTVETIGANATSAGSQTISLVQNDVTSLTFAAPITASQVRLRFHSNFGGSYAALREVTLRNGPGMGRPAVPAVPPTQVVHRIPYTVGAGLPTWNTTYAPSNMQDSVPSSYWCTPMGQAFPFTATLTLASPSLVRGVLFDNRLPGYETSGAQGVTVTAFGPAGDVLTTTSASLPRAAPTMVPLPMPVTTTRIDVTFTSNHGGSYTGLAELVIQ